MIEVCPNCSNVNITTLETMVGSDKVTLNCVGSCGSHPGKSVGYIRGEFVEHDSEEAFVQAVQSAL